ncbi:hypothetical protein J8L98_07905 [Pseudoalteromonas sp. MMG013]|uniref:Uncharacterized protein n=1 Tax=Pseudoalteromonas aurantia 208 TaxID=1314867 RepID=A0ABR9E9U0_9GAMM|nr:MULTISPECIES: hypothetical protein [Pseudoalteromonas]MBE0367025.1 hypothetical protein [Pseudoalteromonas aurantia 208]MBQ4847484.1 hypothetical protein [Pseudoalteromonas sp. MMG005]MBQ4861612.1 hypothetical protein [Pseudoalteromonas sp. MMG013]
MNLLKYFSVLLCVISVLGCASKQQQMSTLEVRSMQTKEYDSTTQLVVFKALINALLDRGFTLTSSDSDAGVVLANSTTTQTNGTEVLTKAVATYFTLGLNWVFGDNNLDDTISIDISANVTQLKGITRVRINAIAKRLNSSGEVVESDMIVEPQYYNSIFEQIEKSVFLEQNLD